MARKPQEPLQQRSRERRAAILAAASRIIAADGTEGLKMSAVAAAVGISMGSLYQYFSDRAAVIEALALTFNAESRACVEAAFARSTDTAGLLDAFAQLTDDYFDIVRSDPAMRHIWAGMQSAPKLLEQQLEESRAVADILAAKILSLRATSNRPDPNLACLAIWELGEAAVRLALALPGSDGEAIVSTYKSMALAELRKLLSS